MLHPSIPMKALAGTLLFPTATFKSFLIGLRSNGDSIQSMITTGYFPDASEMQVEKRTHVINKYRKLVGRLDGKIPAVLNSGRPGK